MFKRAALGALLLLVAFTGTPYKAIADTTVCTTPEQKAACQAQYDALQQEIAQWQQVVDDTKAKKNSLTGDVSALTAQINQAQAQIKQKNIAISQLSDEINQKAARITSLESQLDDQMASLAKLIRQKNESDTYSLVTLALSAQTFSDFFDDVQQREAVQNALQQTYTQVKTVKTQTEQEKTALDTQKNSQLDAKYVVQTKEQQIAADKTQKNQLLTITTNQEKQYQAVLADRQAKAATIRAALFPLRDASSINFGDALTYAQAAQKKTGVDPALILAVLTQESNLGTNVGQCYLTDDTTGAGVGKNTGKVFTNVMKPTRDVPPFLALSQSLGFDPHHQVVSCPIPSAGGYGGAMGPAQFIPSTWATYQARIAAALGVSTPNPWNAPDAIMAMSLYFDDLGATSGSYSANHTAAAKYYAGGSWATAGQTYANQVMAKVTAIQQNIDFLNNI